MGLMFNLVIMVAFGAACAGIAHSRGRSAVGWFFIGVLAGCIGLIILLVLPNVKLEQERHDQLRRENRRLRERMRKERQVSDQRHAAVEHRLGVHDEAIGIDTSRAEQQHLAPGGAPDPAPPPPPPPPPGPPRRGGGRGGPPPPGARNGAGPATS